jgi:sterol desaturase/sphingolipid hydroxylase (fatty acid hydroxylase superfamily)
MAQNFPKTARTCRLNLIVINEMNTHHHPSGQIFHNPFLESLTRTSLKITCLFYPSVILLFIYLNLKLNDFSFVSNLLLYISGCFLWTFVEYILHRFVFHYEHGHPIAQRMHYVMHGVHHEFPRDEERLFMPPLPGSFIILVKFSLFYLLMGKHAFIFEAGMLNGYFVYVLIHYLIHTHKPVPGFKILWTHHALHHYKHQDKAFGVSSPFWDHVFGTMPQAKQRRLPDITQLRTKDQFFHDSMR